MTVSLHYGNKDDKDDMYGKNMMMLMMTMMMMMMMKMTMFVLSIKIINTEIVLLDSVYIRLRHI